MVKTRLCTGGMGGEALPESPLAKNAGAVYLLSLARGPGTRDLELTADESR